MAVEAPTSLVATSLDYNQVKLTYTEPGSGNQWGYDIETSWDGGSTWHWYRRILTGAKCLTETGRDTTGAVVLAGLKAGVTYHWRMRGVYPDVSEEVFSTWSNTDSATQPSYRTGPAYPTREGGDGATGLSEED